MNEFNLSWICCGCPNHPCWFVLPRSFLAMFFANWRISPSFPSPSCHNCRRRKALLPFRRSAWQLTPVPWSSILARTVDTGFRAQSRDHGPKPGGCRRVSKKSMKVIKCGSVVAQGIEPHNDQSGARQSNKLCFAEYRGTKSTSQADGKRKIVRCE